MPERFIKSIVRNGAGAWGAVTLVHKTAEFATTKAAALYKAGVPIDSPQMLALDGTYDTFNHIAMSMKSPENIALAGASLVILIAIDTAWKPHNERFSGRVIRNGLGFLGAGVLTFAPAILDVMRHGAPVSFETNVLPVVVLTLLAAGGKMFAGALMSRRRTAYVVPSREQSQHNRSRSDLYYKDGTRKPEEQKTPWVTPKPKQPAEYLPTDVEMRAFTAFINDVESGRADSDEHILNEANYFEDRFTRAELNLKPRDVGEDNGKIKPEDLPRYTATKNGLENLRSKAVQIGVDAAGRLWPYPKRPN